MKVDVSFKFAKVYDIEKIDVVIGEKFSLFTDLDPAAEISHWFSDNDPVLSMGVNGNHADLEATGLGTSIILIMNKDYATIKKLIIRVVAEIIEPAAELGLSAEEPVIK